MSKAEGRSTAIRHTRSCPCRPASSVTRMTTSFQLATGGSGSDVQCRPVGEGARQSPKTERGDTGRYRATGGARGVLAGSSRDHLARGPAQTATVRGWLPFGRHQRPRAESATSSRTLLSPHVRVIDGRGVVGLRVGLGRKHEWLLVVGFIRAIRRRPEGTCGGVGPGPRHRPGLPGRQRQRWRQLEWRSPSTRAARFRTAAWTSRPGRPTV